MVFYNDKKKDNRDKIVENELKKESGEENILNKEKTIIGFVTFILISLVIIPELLLRMNLKKLLPIYLPNVDMVATILSWYGGPYNIWNDLYNEYAEDYMSYISQTSINWIALIGMIYVIVDISRVEGMYVGWTYGLVMSLCSYLLPSRILENIMDMVYLKTKMLAMSILSALFTMLLILYSERKIIYYLKDELSLLGKKVIKLNSVFDIFK